MVISYLFACSICLYLKWLVTSKKFIALIAAKQTKSVNVDNFVNLVQNVLIKSICHCLQQCLICAVKLQYEKIFLFPIYTRPISGF